MWQQFFCWMNGWMKEFIWLYLVISKYISAMIYFCRLKEKSYTTIRANTRVSPACTSVFIQIKLALIWKVQRCRTAKPFSWVAVQRCFDSQVCLNLIVVHNIFQPVDSVKGCRHLATQEQRSRISYWWDQRKSTLVYRFNFLFSSNLMISVNSFEAMN